MRKRILLASAIFAWANLYFYNRGWNEGYNLGKLSEFGRSFIHAIQIDIHRASHFSPQFERNGWCNNCGKDILEHCGVDLRCCNEN